MLSTEKHLLSIGQHPIAKKINREGKIAGWTGVLGLMAFGSVELSVLYVQSPEPGSYFWPLLILVPSVLAIVRAVNRFRQVDRIIISS